MHKRLVMILGLTLAPLAFSGCSDAPAVTGSMEEATVKGVVKIRGKAATGGKVTFRGSNINRPNAKVVEADIGKDGTFTAKPLIGKNFVEISSKDLMTARNRELTENEQLVDIPSGEATLNIELPATGPLKVQ